MKICGFFGMTWEMIRGFLGNLDMEFRFLGFVVGGFLGWGGFGSWILESREF
jgi:hypothetical protein